MRFNLSVLFCVIFLFGCRDESDFYNADCSISGGISQLSYEGETLVTPNFTAENNRDHWQEIKLDYSRMRYDDNSKITISFIDGSVQVTPFRGKKVELHAAVCKNNDTGIKSTPIDYAADQLCDDKSTLVPATEYKNTGLRVFNGDRVIVSAAGSTHALNGCTNDDLKSGEVSLVDFTLDGSNVTIDESCRGFDYELGDEKHRIVFGPHSGGSTNYSTIVSRDPSPKGNKIYLLDEKTQTASTKIEFKTFEEYCRNYGFSGCDVVLQGLRNSYSPGVIGDQLPKYETYNLGVIKDPAKGAKQATVGLYEYIAFLINEAKSDPNGPEYIQSILKYALALHDKFLAMRFIILTHNAFLPDRDYTQIDFHTIQYTDNGPTLYSEHGGIFSTLGNKRNINPFLICDKRLRNVLGNAIGMSLESADDIGIIYDDFVANKDLCYADFDYTDLLDKLSLAFKTFRAEMVKAFREARVVSTSDMENFTKKLYETPYQGQLSTARTTTKGTSTVTELYDGFAHYNNRSQNMRDYFKDNFAFQPFSLFQIPGLYDHTNTYTTYVMYHERDMYTPYVTLGITRGTILLVGPYGWTKEIRNGEISAPQVTVTPQTRTNGSSVSFANPAEINQEICDNFSDVGNADVMKFSVYDINERCRKGYVYQATIKQSDLSTGFPKVEYPFLVLKIGGGSSVNDKGFCIPSGRQEVCNNPSNGSSSNLSSGLYRITSNNFSEDGEDLFANVTQPVGSVDSLFAGGYTINLHRYRELSNGDGFSCYYGNDPGSLKPGDPGTVSIKDQDVVFETSSAPVGSKVYCGFEQTKDNDLIAEAKAIGNQGKYGSYRIKYEYESLPEDGVSGNITGDSATLSVLDDVTRTIRNIIRIDRLVSLGNEQFKKNVASMAFFIKAILIILITFIGFGYVSGMLPVSLEHISMTIVRMTILVHLVSPSSWNFYNDVLFSNIEPILKHMISSMSSGIDVDYLGGYGRILEMLISSNTWKHIWYLICTSFMGVFYAVVLIYSFWHLLKNCFKGSIMYYMSLAVSAFCISIAPLFISSLAFRQFRNLFDGWFKVLIGYIMQPLFFYVTMGVLIGIIEGAIIQAKDYRTCKMCYYNYEVSIVGFPLFSFCIYEGNLPYSYASDPMNATSRYEEKSRSPVNSEGYFYGMPFDFATLLLVYLVAIFSEILLHLSGTLSSSISSFFYGQEGIRSAVHKYTTDIKKITGFDYKSKQRRDLNQSAVRRLGANIEALRRDRFSARDDLVDKVKEQQKQQKRGRVQIRPDNNSQPSPGGSGDESGNSNPRSNPGARPGNPPRDDSSNNDLNSDDFGEN